MIAFFDVLIAEERASVLSQGKRRIENVSPLHRGGIGSPDRTSIKCMWKAKKGIKKKLDVQVEDLKKDVAHLTGEKQALTNEIKDLCKATEEE